MAILLQRLLVLADGERAPILLSAETLAPDYESNVFLLTARRQAGLASSQLTKDAAVIKHVHAWAATRPWVDGHPMELKARFSRGEYLTLPETDSLAATFTLPYPELLKQTTAAPVVPIGRALRAAAQAGTAATEPAPSVSPSYALERSITCRLYLSFLSDLLAPTEGSPAAERIAGRQERDRMLGWLKARQVAGGSTSKREGLSEDQLATLRSLVDPESPSNPWKEPFVRQRNYLIISIFLALGIRRGEFLGLRATSINFQSNTLDIARNPDDKKDPRKDEPNTKTKERTLPMTDDLADDIQEYITDWRSKITAANKHTFLLVSEAGRPLSKSALDAMFSDIKLASAALSALCAHVLRLTWNDEYSELMESRGTSESEEIRTRSYLMGWVETSGTAATYTRRHVRRKANEASLQLQRSQQERKNDK